MVAKEACSSRLVSLADRPCKLHFRKDTVFPLPCLCRNQAGTEFRSQKPAKNLARHSLSYCSPRPLVETPRLTLLSLLLVVSKIHSFEEGNCGG
jgi:hypothetical protein